MKAVPPILKNWLQLFAQAVRRRDFAAGKTFFHENSISFGTVCPRSENLGELISRQWQIVWPNTRDFDFDYEQARAAVTAELAVVIANWQSVGFDEKKSTC